MLRLGSSKVNLFFLLKYEGRRRELVIAAILYAIGSLTTALAPDLNVLLVGRLLYGLGIGWVRLPLAFGLILSTSK